MSGLKKVIFVACIFLSIYFVSKKLGSINKVSHQDDWSTTNLYFIKNYIIKGHTLKQTFNAFYNNLGIISVTFDNPNILNNGTLIFKLFDGESGRQLFENKYRMYSFKSNVSFPFGFPLISNSKGKKFIFELSTEEKIATQSVNLAQNTSFSTKYIFSVSALLTNKKLINQLLLIIMESMEIFLLKKRLLIVLTIILCIGIASYIYFLKKINLLIAKYKNHIQLTYPFILFLVTFIISSYFSSIGTDPHHDGILLKPAIDVINGKMLFRETYTQYGALTTLLQSFTLLVFGGYLLSIKILTAFFYGLISILIYILWSKFMSKNISFVTTILWLLLAPYYVWTFLPWSSVYALFFQCFTLLCFVIYYKSRHNLWWLLFAGIFSSLTFWCKQNVGGETIGASISVIVLMIFLNKEKLKRMKIHILCYSLGGLLSSAPIFFWLITNNALVDWWKQSILFAISFVKSKDSNILSSLFPPSVGPISIWVLIPIASIIVLLIELTKNKKGSPTTLIIVALFGLFSWLQYYPVTCIRHVYWGATPMIGLLIYLLLKLSKLISKKNIIQWIFFIFILIVVFYPDVQHRIDGGYKKIFSAYKTLNDPQILKGMMLTDDEYYFYKGTYDSIITYENKFGKTNFVTNGTNALYLTFIKSDNFHPLYINIQTDIYPEYPTLRDNYFQKRKSLIMAMWNQVPPGYCKLNNLINTVDTAFLLAPCK